MLPGDCPISDGDDDETEDDHDDEDAPENRNMKALVLDTEIQSQMKPASC